MYSIPISNQLITGYEVNYKKRKKFKLGQKYASRSSFILLSTNQC